MRDFTTQIWTQIQLSAEQRFRTLNERVFAFSRPRSRRSRDLDKDVSAAPTGRASTISAHAATWTPSWDAWAAARFECCCPGLQALPGALPWVISRLPPVICCNSHYPSAMLPPVRLVNSYGGLRTTFQTSFTGFSSAGFSVRMWPSMQSLASISRYL